ncbi:hypothetical protein OIU78_026667 [Salix suchowensis]|nr:hypothetical protein OIU78_026667 [Salix suchowensis]
MFCMPRSVQKFTLSLKICGRVPDLLPLYDTMNQFQKGHSHMAVVVSGSYQLGQNDQFIIPVNSPSVYSSGTGIESPKPINSRNLKDNLHPKLQNQEHQHGNLSHEELEFLSASDEEVVGVITLEDVMGELIQVMNKLSVTQDIHSSSHEESQT